MVVIFISIDFVYEVKKNSLIARAKYTKDESIMCFLDFYFDLYQVIFFLFIVLLMNIYLLRNYYEI